MDMGVSTALGAFVTYAIASAFFWHYPHFLHKRKRIAFVARHISHRGGSAEGYENTIRAFQNALNKGSDMLELDVRLTRDGKVVVFHDPDLLRMTGKASKISDVDYNKLPTFCCNVPIDTIPGTYFCDSTWSDEDRRIPLLSQVFSHFPNVPMNIDIKDNDDKLIEEVSRLLNTYNRKEITVWGSFNNRVCQKCYAINPDSCLFFSAKRVLVLIIFAVFGILPFVPIKETHYEVFLPLSLKRRRLQQSGSFTWSEKVLLWVSETFLVWKPLITHLKKRGIHVYFWVCNTDDEFAMCQSIGATGIMTDHPTKLRQFLNDNGANEKSVPEETGTS